MGYGIEITEGRYAGSWEAHGRIDGAKFEHRTDRETGRRFPSQLAAKRYADRREARAALGELGANDTWTIGQFVRQVLDDACGDLRPLSIGTYTNTVRTLEAHPTFTTRRAKQHLNAQTVENVKAWMLRPKDQGGRGLGPKTTGDVMGWIRRTARAAVIAKAIPYATLLEIVAVRRPKLDDDGWRVPMTLEQAHALAAALPAFYQAAALVQAGTGLRQGEVRGLRVQDITMPTGIRGAVGGRILRTARHGSLRIYSQVDKNGTRGPVKSSGRDVPLLPPVARLLAAHMDRWRPITMDPGDERVFYVPAEFRHRLTLPRNVMGCYGPAVAAAGELAAADDPDWPPRPDGKRITSHDLRHHWVCLQSQNGVPIAKIAKWAGDTEKTIMRVYLNAMPGETDDGLDLTAEQWETLPESITARKNGGKLVGTDGP